MMKKAFLPLGHLFCTAIAVLCLWSCSPKGQDLTTDIGTLQEGDRLAENEFFEEARKQYLRIKTEFPQSRLQVEANLKIAETYYKEEAYATAATSYEEFIRTYPGRPEIPEALYRLGMCYVRQMPSTPQRDTRPTAKAVDTFTRLMIDYPQNSHAAEAQQWIDKARNQLAQKIYQIASFYERMGDYESAARRFGDLAEQFSEHPLMEEAMARQVKNLYKAKQNERADRLAERFQEKFPKSKFETRIK